MKTMINIITFPFKIIAYILIIMYKLLISPFLPHTCRYTPTCSMYAFSALREFGFFKGSILSAKRLLRCTPNGGSGYDPVPINIKGDYKWLI